MPFKTIIEPFRIKTVEPIRHTTREEREAALREAAAVAALNCRGAGAQAGLPDTEAVQRFLETDPIELGRRT